MSNSTLALAAGALLLGGCAWLPQAGRDVDSAFGQSVRAHMELQATNPQAGRGDPSTGGFDAQAARHALARHRDSFKAPPPTFTIFGIGGSPGGGGAQ